MNYNKFREIVDTLDMYSDDNDVDLCELTIKKCIEICVNSESEKSWNNDWKAGRKSCAKEIKEYFGIE